MGGLDFKNDGHTQLVPVAGQGADALQLLALGPEGISYFPPKVLSGQPLFLQLNRIFCLIDVTEYSETVMFTTTVAVFHCILHLSAAQKHSSHPLNESYPSTVFLGRYCVISFPKQKSRALKLNALPRHECVYGTEQGEAAMHQEGKDSAVSPGLHGLLQPLLLCPEGQPHAGSACRLQ